MNEIVFHKQGWTVSWEQDISPFLDHLESVSEAEIQNRASQMRELIQKHAPAASYYALIVWQCMGSRREIDGDFVPGIGTVLGNELLWKDGHIEQTASYPEIFAEYLVDGSKINFHTHPKGSHSDPSPLDKIYALATHGLVVLAPSFREATIVVPKVRLQLEHIELLKDRLLAAAPEAFDTQGINIDSAFTDMLEATLDFYIEKVQY